MASVLSVLEEQLVLQGLANNEPEIQRKKKKPGFNYALYHRNKTNLDTYKSDVTTNDVFLRIRMKLSQLAWWENHAVIFKRRIYIYFFFFCKREKLFWCSFDGTEASGEVVKSVRRWGDDVSTQRFKWNKGEEPCI